MVKEESIGMKKIIFISLILFNIFGSLWYVLNGDLYFHVDMARDFLLFNEVEEKKIVLIGPRAGAAGMFQGPLWLYVNFPVYYLSGGNPVAVGWFWVFLIVVFLIVNFKIAKRLVSEEAAYFYVLLVSAYIVPFAKEFTHPHGALLVFPVFFYTLILYLKKFNYRYFVFHVLLAGVIIQLEMAAGVPYLILSFSYIFYQQLRKRKFEHFWGYLLILLPLATYILFDLRHDFFQFKSLLIYLKGSPREHYVGFINILKNRLDFITGPAVPMVLFPQLRVVNKILAVLFVGGVTVWARLLISQDIRRPFLFLFFGYFVISLFSRYELLIHQVIAFVPIVFLIISSLVTTRRIKWLAVLCVAIIGLNELFVFKYLFEARKFINKNEDSWKVLDEISGDVFKDAGEGEFGYFVYSPDKIGYEGKYAMVYGQKKFPKIQANYFKKKPVTYVVCAPHPPNDPFVKCEWWVLNSVKINKSPVSVVTYPNGYKVERYELTSEEIAVQADPWEDSGIHFR